MKINVDDAAKLLQCNDVVTRPGICLTFTQIFSWNITVRVLDRMTSRAARFRKRITDNPYAAPTANLTWVRRLFGAPDYVPRKEVRNTHVQIIQVVHKFYKEKSESARSCERIFARLFLYKSSSLINLIMSRKITSRSKSLNSASTRIRGFSSQQEKRNFRDSENISLKTRKCLDAVVYSLCIHNKRKAKKTIL